MLNHRVRVAQVEKNVESCEQADLVMMAVHRTVSV